MGYSCGTRPVPPQFSQGTSITTLGSSRISPPLSPGRRAYLGELRKHVVHPSLPGGSGVLIHQPPGRTRMKLHANARLTPAARLLLCRRVLEERRPLAEAAEAAGVSGRTARKWLRRYRTEGREGLADRSSRPHRMPRRTAPERER